MLPGPDLGVVGGAGVVATVPVPWNSTRGGGTVGLLLVTGFGGLKTESVMSLVRHSLADFNQSQDSG